MAKRVPAVDAHAPIAFGRDRGTSVAGREELVKLATRLIIEETLEAEARDAVGRDYYEHGRNRARAIATVIGRVG